MDNTERYLEIERRIVNATRYVKIATERAIDHPQPARDVAALRARMDILRGILDALDRVLTRPER